MQVFGSDPSGLPLVMDMGVQVPEVLVNLRDMLYLLHPHKIVGIFREAGNENEMKQIIKNLNAGLSVRSENPHSIATLIKVPPLPSPSFLLPPPR